MSQKPSLRDLIYFDFEKTASIASQLEGGLIKEVQESFSHDAELGGGFKAYFLNAGMNVKDTESTLITQGIHHDLLERVERALLDDDVAVDLNQVDPNSKSIKKLHEILSEKPYVLVEGICCFHDYQRMKTYMDGFNKILEFVENLKRDSIKKYLQKQIEKAEKQIEGITDRNDKKTKERKIKDLKNKLDDMVDEGLQKTSQKIPEWQIEGIKNVINVLMPNRHNLLIQPFDDLEQFKIISNLKQDCFVDSDSDNVLFHYGSQPKVKLTVFGLVTSIPNIKIPKPNIETPNIETPSDSSGESDSNQSTDSDIERFEQVFNNVFDATTQIEKFGLFAYYPRVIVYPLAVYYTIRK